MGTSLKIESTDGARNTYNTNVNYINESCADGTLRTFADKLFELSNNTVHSVAKITTTDITNAQPQPEPSQGVVVTENQIKIIHPNFSDDTVLKGQLFAYLSNLIQDEVTDITGVTDTSRGCEATVLTTNTEDPIQTAYVVEIEVSDIIYVAVADVPSGTEITRYELAMNSNPVYGWTPMSFTQMIHSYLDNTLTWANAMNLSFASAAADYEKVAGEHFANYTFAGNTITFTFDWSKIKTEGFQGTGSVYCGTNFGSDEDLYTIQLPYLNFNGFMDSYLVGEPPVANMILIETGKYFTS